MDKLYDELLVELECPICMNYMAPPIRQCATGHGICEQCRKKLPACPLCQGPITGTRNISLEALARKMHYPCANSKSGCTERLTLDEHENHERECSYKEYKCYYIKCTWKGRYEDLLEHWSQKKISSRPHRSINVCYTKIQTTETFCVNMVQAYDELFWYKFKSSGGKMYWTVQYIGDPEKANDYYFEIELFKPGQPLRKTLMSEYCQAVDIDYKNLFKAGTCVITTTEAIAHFFGDDQLLIYYMRVKEVGESGERTPRDQSFSRKSINQDTGRKDYVSSRANRKHNLIETECSSRKFLLEKPVVVYSETFNNICLTQGSEPASRDISPNNNTSDTNSSSGGGHNTHGSAHSKPGDGVKQSRSLYKLPHRPRFSKSAPQPPASTPTHPKRKRPVKSTQIKDLD